MNEQRKAIKPTSTRIGTNIECRLGQPRLLANDVLVETVVAGLLAGDSIRDVADWWAITPAQVRACARYAMRSIELRTAK